MELNRNKIIELTLPINLILPKRPQYKNYQITIWKRITYKYNLNSIYPAV
jgi:hypothetical protein